MLVPKLPSMFRTTRNQQFEYKPIYWDEKKERKKALDREVAAGKTGSGSRRIKFHSTEARSFGKSNVKIALLVVLLTGLAAYIISY